MSSQQHAPAALYPRERLGKHFIGGWVGPRPVWKGGKSRPHGDTIPDRPVGSSVAIQTELPGPKRQGVLKENHGPVWGSMEKVPISVPSCTISASCSRSTTATAMYRKPMFEKLHTKFQNILKFHLRGKFANECYLSYTAVVSPLQLKSKSTQIAASVHICNKTVSHILGLNCTSKISV